MTSYIKCVVFLIVVLCVLDISYSHVHRKPRGKLQHKKHRQIRHPSYNHKLNGCFRHCTATHPDPNFYFHRYLKNEVHWHPPRQGLNKDYFHHGHRHHCGAHSSLNSNEEKHKPTPESAVKSIYITVPSKFLVILIAEKSPCILTLT